MGALFLIPDKTPYPKQIDDLFIKKGFINNPTIINEAGYRIMIFPKQLFSQPQIISKDDCKLIIVGTCFYKGKGYFEGMNNIINDYLNDSFRSSVLTGNFLLLIIHRNKIKFFSDKTGIFNIFYNKETKIITTSFLAAVVGTASLTGKVKLNRKAATEVLVTGNLIGPETLVKQVERYEPLIHNDLFEIERLPDLIETKSENIPLNFNYAVKEQLDVLMDYFKLMKQVLDDKGVVTGLTGGLDSRLLFFLLKKNTINLQLFSTYREIPSSDLSYAEIIAKNLGVKLFSPYHTNPIKMTEDDFKMLFKDNFYFNDGLIRTHNIWLEEIKSKRYLINLYKEKRVGMNGVGGEQYRNAEYLIGKKHHLLRWVHFEIVYRNCGNVFINVHSRKQIIRHIATKILVLLHINLSQKSITKYDIKRYYNEVYNSANRTLRNNIENQLIYYLSPFTEYNISRKAYKSIPFQKTSHEFEKEMIRLLYPELSNLPTNYGFAINGRIPFRYLSIAFIKRFFGLRFYNTVFYLRKRRAAKGLKNLFKTHHFLRHYENKVRKLNLPITISQLVKSDYLGALVLELGIFLEIMNDYLDIDYDEKTF